MSGDDQKTLVSGAGIVGLACAYFLNTQGRSVRIIHDTPLDATASYGNAGAIAMAEIIPLAGLGILLNVPKWLIDPLGSLSIKASYAPKLWPWFWRFVKAGTSTNRRTLTQAMVGLLKKEGSLFIYRNEHARLTDQEFWAMRRDCGVEFIAIDRKGVLAYWWDR